MREQSNSLDGVTLGGKWVLGQVIGVGGMGVVCEAQHVTLGRKFAVKLVAKALRTEMMATRFRREVRAISAIESEHIVDVLDVGVDERFGLYMVMEFLGGEDLSARLLRDGRVEVRQAVKIAEQIALGLAKAHACKIIHRDLKPANVFLQKREDGSVRVKILDFGISKLLDGEHKSDTWSGDLTEYGMPVGTAQYMSPEQAKGLGDVDHRTDVWALGVVLYEMLAGRPAYPPQRNHAQTLLRVLTEKPPSLEEVAPWVPRSVVRVVEKALQHQMAQRIPDCTTFARMLGEAVDPARSSVPTTSVLLDGLDDDDIDRRDAPIPPAAPAGVARGFAGAAPVGPALVAVDAAARGDGAHAAGDRGIGPRGRRDALDRVFDRAPRRAGSRRADRANRHDHAVARGAARRSRARGRPGRVRRRPPDSLHPASERRARAERSARAVGHAERATVRLGERADRSIVAPPRAAEQPRWCWRLERASAGSGPRVGPERARRSATSARCRGRGRRDAHASAHARVCPRLRRRRSQRRRPVDARRERRPRAAPPVGVTSFSGPLAMGPASVRLPLYRDREVVRAP